MSLQTSLTHTPSLQNSTILEKVKKEKNVLKKKNHCNICKKTIIGTSYKFKAHLYQHNAVKPRFKCCYCSMEFFRSDAYTRHVNKHKGISKRKVFTCDHCDRSFVEKRNLIIHLKIHEDHHFFQFTCTACGVSYCEERLLKYHIRKAHYNLHEQESIHIKKKLNETWVERVKESTVCVQMTKIDTNTLSIQKFGTIKQDVDEKMSIEKTEFKEYISSVFAQKDKSQYSKAVCDYCKKEMLKKSLLSHIRERHLKLRRFKCEDCGSDFSRHYQLVGHICGKFRSKPRK